MSETAFQPNLHGFDFPNYFTQDLQNPFTGGNVIGRCGGMSYAATDYFSRGSHAPRTGPKTPYGDALGDYIWARQLDSFGDSWDKWTVMPLQSDDQLRAWMFDDELPKIRARIDSGRAHPIGLISSGAVVEHHQVVACGYRVASAQEASLRIYDPNHPGPTLMILRLSRHGLIEQVARSGASWTPIARWRMAFFKDGYQPR